MTNNKLTLLSKAIDNCSREQLDLLFSLIGELGPSATKVEMISHCLNTELSTYGFQTFIAPDKITVMINDESMSQILSFFKKSTYQPHITNEQIERVKTIAKVAKDNKVSLFWSQTGIRRKYYYLKQYGFNGVNLYNVLNINTANTATATLSSTGAAAMTMSGVIAISWTGSLFCSTLENYIPVNMTKTRVVVTGAKFIIALPIRCVEWTSNQMLGCVESLVVGLPLPTNVTEVYNLNVGPKLENIQSLRKPVFGWLANKLKIWSSSFSCSISNS